MDQFKYFIFLSFYNYNVREVILSLFSGEEIDANTNKYWNQSKSSIEIIINEIK